MKALDVSSTGKRFSYLLPVLTSIKVYGLSEFFVFALGPVTLNLVVTVMTTVVAGVLSSLIFRRTPLV